MKKINAMLVAAVVASLVLVAGCYDGGSPTSTPPGYDGLVAMGWECFEAGDYSDNGGAMEHFLAAIDVDVSRPEAYVGAGWTSILLPNFWQIGNQYDYMALQLDGGVWPVEQFIGSLEQDLSWSVFECTYPLLTANDITVINAWGTTDTLIIDDTLVVFEPDSLKPAMDNVEIGDWLYLQYSNMRFQYKFEIDDPNVIALFTADNDFSLTVSSVDSIVNGASSSTVYISVPYFRQTAGEEAFRTWCMYENGMTYEYATYESNGSLPFGSDALAAYGILQDTKGENGDEFFGVAVLLGLANEGDYSFEHYSGVTSMNLRGMAAAMTFRNLHFRPALRICQEAGYALDVEVSDPDFLIELMQAIDTMLQ